MKKYRYIIPVAILFAVCVFFPSNQVKAEEVTLSDDEGIAVQSGVILDIDNYISATNAFMTINTTSKVASCTFEVETERNFLHTITMSIQRSSGGTSFSDYKVWSYTLSGAGRLTKTENFTLPSGYYYKLKVNVDLWSGGAIMGSRSATTNKKYV